MRNVIPAVVAVVMAAGAGCHHITTRVPGTLDMRSDGAGATPGKTDPKKVPADIARTGFDSILWGDGVAANSGATIDVSDRKYWAIGLISIANESETEELNAVLANGGVRKVVIGEKESGTDVLIGFVPYALQLIPFVGNLAGAVAAIVTPPRTTTLTGELISGYGTAAPAAAASTTTPPPAAP
jgi:hypothetical protein